MWRYLLAILAALSADPAQIDREAPRASAAVSAAYATTAVEKAPEPQPEPWIFIATSFTASWNAS